MRPALSILCPSMRSEFLDRRLLAQVHSSKWRKRVEFLLLHDNQRLSTGKKMEHLVNISTGDFVMFVADDDIVSPKMIPLMANLLDPSRYDGAGYQMRILPQIHGKSMTCSMGPTLAKENGEIVDGEQFWNWHPILPTRRTLYEGIEFPDASLREDTLVAKQMDLKLVPKRWTFLDDELYFAFPQEGIRWGGEVKSNGGIA